MHLQASPLYLQYYPYRIITRHHIIIIVFAFTCFSLWEKFWEHRVSEICSALCLQVPDWLNTLYVMSSRDVKVVAIRLRLESSRHFCF